MFPTYPFIFLTILLGQGDGTGEPGAKKPAADHNAVEVRYADGSVVKMSLLQDTIEVMTRFGKLTVPTTAIRRIEFGLRLPEETTRRIDEAVGKLGSHDFKEREAASADLLALKELAFPAVQRAARSPDLETARRARDVLKVMRDKIPAEKLELKENDVLQTTDFPIVGRIETATLKARTAYFGDVQVRLSEVRSMRWLASGAETEITVEASKFGLVQEKWLDTEIEVAADTELQITAEGSVDLYPLGNEVGMYMTSPAGSRQWNRGGPYPNGALLGRIGDSGSVFVIGQSYTGQPKQNGRLFLRIVPSPWQVVPSGSYTVRVGLSGGR